MSYLVEWVNTFPSVVPPITDISDLADGSVLCGVLAAIAPTYFDDTKSLFASAGENPVLQHTAVQQLVTSLKHYFVAGLGLDSGLVTERLILDAKAVVGGDEAEIVRLGEHIIASAVQCDAKSTYIERIMGMDQDSQGELMVAIDTVISRYTSRGGDGGDGGEDGAGAGGERPYTPSSPSLETSATPSADAEMSNTFARENEALRQEMAELQRSVTDLSGEASSLQADNDRLTHRNGELEARVKALEHEAKESARTSQRADAAILEMQTQDLYDDVKRKDAEINMLRAQSREDRARFDDEFRAQADELDTARAQLTAMTKLETTLQRYKERVEGMETLRDQVKTLEEQNSSYLDKILDLEADVKSIGTLKTQLESYKEKIVDLETSASQTAAEANVKSSEISSLKAKLAAATEEKTVLDTQLRAATQQVESLRLAAGSGSGGMSFADEAAAGTGLTPAVKEELARLRRENRVLKEGNGTDGESGEVAVLRSELEDQLEVKKRLQAAAAHAQQRATELSKELETVKEALAAATDGDGEGGGSGGAGGGLVAKELEETRAEAAALGADKRQLLKDVETREATIGEMRQQLGVHEVVITDLKTKLKAAQKEKDQLAMDREKLEAFVPRVVKTANLKYEDAQRKHEETVAKLTEQLEDAKKAEQIARETLREQKAAMRRESELISSAFYNIGVDHQRKLLKPSSQVAAAKSPATSLLGRQREHASPLKGMA